MLCCACASGGSGGKAFLSAAAGFSGLSDFSAAGLSAWAKAGMEIDDSDKHAISSAAPRQGNMAFRQRKFCIWIRYMVALAKPDHRAYTSLFFGRGVSLGVRLLQELGRK